MAYTDRQYKDATQIAYVTFLNDANEALPKRDTPYSVFELVSSYNKLDLQKAFAEREKQHPGTQPFDNPVKELKSLIEYSNLPNSTKETLLNISDDSYNWKFITCMDSNTETGFYGCALETSSIDPITKEPVPGELMVAFRGSEGFDSYDNIVNDWYKADAGLLNGRTNQCKEVETFAKILINQGVIDKYDSIDVTGHSLGGNLASHFTVYTSKEHREIFDKIDKCYNLDGPGDTQEYIDSYQPNIEEAGSKIVHYKASIVGNTLKDIPGSEVYYIRVKEEEDTSLLESLGYNTFLRHHTVNWDYEKDGENETDTLIRDNQPDLVSQVVAAETNMIDDLNLEGISLFIVSYVVHDFLTEDEKGKTKLVDDWWLKLFGPFELNPAAKLSALVLLALGIPILIAGLISSADIDPKSLATNTTKGLSIKFKKINFDISHFTDAIEKALKKYLKNNSLSTSLVNYSVNYSYEHPKIKLDTESMKSYSNRLNNINERLKNLDRRIDYLYTKVGLQDIISLIGTDLSIGYNNTIKRCSDYLYNTAIDFENTEKRISNIFQ